MQHRKAFTLLELIVVIFIITIMGGIMFSSSMHKEKEAKKVLDPTTLPTTFRETFKGQGDVELFCVEKGKECYTLQSGKISPYTDGTEFGNDIEIYTLDSDDHFVQLEELGRVKDKKIALRYHLYPNGSTTQMVIKNSDGIFYLPSYFGNAKKVEEMDDAKALWTKEKYDLGDSGSFF